MTLVKYMKVSERKVTRNVLKELRELANRYSNQYALYYYIFEKGKATLHELYKIYCAIAGRRVRLASLRKQLKILEERYKVVEREGPYYVALLPPEELANVIDVKRAQAGKRGAPKRVLNLYRKPEELRVPHNLVHYVSEVFDEVKRLLRHENRTAALDLIAHTYLPLRETDVLWLWRGNEFIYWDNKNHTFRCLRSEKLSKLLRKLGYSEGMMVWHVLGHERAARIIKKLFGKGHLDWPWARSIAYGLMLLGIIEEGNYYRAEAIYRNNHLYFILKNYYTGYLINEYSTKCNQNRLPSPLSPNKKEYRGIALGVPHTNPKNNESYFDRW